MKQILFNILFTMLFVIAYGYNNTTYNNIIECQSFSITSNIKLFSITSTTLPIIIFDNCNNTSFY